jgi:hypothetical protein
VLESRLGPVAKLDTRDGTVQGKQTEQRRPVGAAERGSAAGSVERHATEAGPHPAGPRLTGGSMEAVKQLDLEAGVLIH